MHIYPENDTNAKEFIKSLKWGKLEDYFDGGIHIACAIDYRDLHYTYRGIEEDRYSLGWETDVEELVVRKRFDDLNLKRKKIIKKMEKLLNYDKSFMCDVDEGDLFIEFVLYYLEKGGLERKYICETHRKSEEMGKKLQVRREEEKRYRDKNGNPKYRRLRNKI